MKKTISYTSMIFAVLALMIACGNIIWSWHDHNLNTQEMKKIVELIHADIHTLTLANDKGYQVNK